MPRTGHNGHCASDGAFLNGRCASTAGFRTLQVKPQSRFVACLSLVIHLTLKLAYKREQQSIWWLAEWPFMDELLHRQWRAACTPTHPLLAVPAYQLCTSHYMASTWKALTQLATIFMDNHGQVGSWDSTYNAISGHQLCKLCNWVNHKQYLATVTSVDWRAETGNILPLGCGWKTWPPSSCQHRQNTVIIY